jgi:hypothetical protein
MKTGDKSDRAKEFLGSKGNPGTLSDERDLGSASGKPGWGLPKVDGGGTGPDPAGPAANSGSTASGSPLKRIEPGSPAVPPAANAPASGTSNGTLSKPVSEADMKEVWIYIENRSGASGQMPPPQEVYAALLAAKSPAADLAKSGNIVLTGTRNRDSVWAYEAKALTQGGWVASQNGVETLTAADLTRRLAGR